jgi:hypothetical protein
MIFGTAHLPATGIAGFTHLESLDADFAGDDDE